MALSSSPYETMYIYLTIAILRNSAECDPVLLELACGAISAAMARAQIVTRYGYNALFHRGKIHEIARRKGTTKRIILRDCCMHQVALDREPLYPPVFTLGYKLLHLLRDDRR